MEDLAILITKICVFGIIVYIPILILKWLCGAFPRFFGFLRETKSDTVKKIVAGSMIASGAILTGILGKGKADYRIVEIIPLALGGLFSYLYLSKDDEDFWNWIKHPIRSLNNYFYTREREADFRKRYDDNLEFMNSKVEVQEFLKMVVKDEGFLGDFLDKMSRYIADNDRRFFSTLSSQWYHRHELSDAEKFSQHHISGVSGSRVQDKAYNSLDEYIQHYFVFLRGLREYFVINKNSVVSSWKFEPSFCAIFMTYNHMLTEDKAHEEEMMKVRYFEEQEKLKERAKMKEDALSAKKRSRFDLSDL